MKVLILSDQLSQGGAAQATGRIGASMLFASPFLRCSCFLREQIEALCEDRGDEVCQIVHFPIDEKCKANLLHVATCWYEETAIKRQAYRVPRKLFPNWFPHPYTPAFAEQRLRRFLHVNQP